MGTLPQISCDTSAEDLAVILALHESIDPTTAAVFLGKVFRYLFYLLLCMCAIGLPSCVVVCSLPMKSFNTVSNACKYEAMPMVGL